MPGKRCFQNAGQIYYGDIVETDDGRCRRHGQGLQIIKSTTVAGDEVIWGQYKGAWKDDAMTGSGTYRWSDGSFYEGYLLDGKMHGAGKLTWPEGSAYDGAWLNNEMVGQGSFYNAFTNLLSEGEFYRNCLRNYDGSWLDVSSERERLRVERLAISALPPGWGDSMPVSRCSPSKLGGHVASVLREAPFRVPLIVADAACPENRPGGGPGNVAPLWCLEEGDHGCAPQTTVHLAFAAAERQRGRDYQQHFRAAIREALLTYRIFTLVFGDADEPGSAKPPDAWSLQRFFGQQSLPLDLFDLRHFHCSGGAEPFLPPEKRGNRSMYATPSSAAAPPPPGAVSPVEQSEPMEQLQEEASGEDAPAPVQACAPPTVHLLHFALVSLRHLDADLDDDSIRAHVLRRFVEHIPLHHVSVVVVSGSD